MSYGLNGSKVPEGYQQGRIQQFTPGQISLFQNMLGNLGPNSFLNKLASGDAGQFEQMEAPAWRQFNQAQGENASRFSGMGLGARHGSGFKNAQGAAASNFAQDLQAKRLEYQRQAIQDIMGYGNQLLQQRPYENYLIKNQPEPEPWNDILGGVASAIPGAVTGFLSGGPPGAAVGAATSFASNFANKNPQSGSQQVANYQFRY